MITYLIKGILCSALLWAFHFFFLEKEKMHRFNRFYLLLAPVVSLLIPFVPLKMAPETAMIAGIGLFPVVTSASVTADTVLPVTTAPFGLVPVIYFTITFLLTVRFLRNLLRLARCIRSHQKAATSQTQFVLIPGHSTIYSFMNYIFCNKDQYENGTIAPQILRHELVHVRQKHSWDIVFLELLQVFYWFNPMLPFYKRSVQLNHEFLADQPITLVSGDIRAYQRLLMDQLMGAPNPLISHFNYSQTKKRLLMMTRIGNTRQMLWKIAALLPCAGLLLYTFSDELKAQSTPPAVLQQPAPPPPPLDVSELPVAPPPPPPTAEKRTFGNGVSKDEIAGYIASFEEHKIEKTNAKGNTYPAFSFSIDEKKRLYAVYRKMNREQQQEQRYILVELPAPVRTTPSEALYQSFKNEAVYGVWLDGKKVANSVLDTYTRNDIAEYTISKLYGAAKKGRSYTHQLDLTTNTVFDAGYAERMRDRIVASERIRKQPAN